MEKNDRQRKLQNNKRKLLVILSHKHAQRKTVDIKVTDMEQFAFLQEASVQHKFKITRIKEKPSIKRSFAKKMPDAPKDTSFTARVEFY